MKLSKFKGNIKVGITSFCIGMLITEGVTFALNKSMPDDYFNVELSTDSNKALVDGEMIDMDEVDQLLENDFQRIVDDLTIKNLSLSDDAKKAIYDISNTSVASPYLDALEITSKNVGFVYGSYFKKPSMKELPIFDDSSSRNLQLKLKKNSSIFPEDIEINLDWEKI